MRERDNERERAYIVYGEGGVKENASQREERQGRESKPETRETHIFITRKMNGGERQRASPSVT